MYEVVKSMGVVILIAVYCLCSLFVVLCIRDITKITVEKMDTLQGWRKKKKKTKGKNKPMISFHQFVEYLRKEMGKRF
ncbi:MAG: hypothetical protein HFG55_13330 [Lachnospiraceae bacterium]|nr:hypothetical protein [Lachnospiraceae bacterium]